MEISDIKPGTYLEIKTDDSTYAGVLMPSPSLADKGHIILKLDNGYNMGIREDKIQKIKKLQKKHTLEKFPIQKVPKNSNLPSISLFGCGGTIASRVDYETGGVKSAMSPEEIFFTVPELKDIANIKDAKLLFNDFSQDLTPKHWKKMAKEAAYALNQDIEGTVLMHGTDTMYYSSAALSFMLKNLSKPVVLTGAQRSSDRGSSDAAQNLICSAHLAANSDLGEVVICMHGSSSDDFCFAHRGTKVRKMHTSRRDAFRSINAKPLLKVFPKGKIEKISDYRRKGGGEVYADTDFEEKTALIKPYPGSSPEIIDFLIDKKYRGIVIEATGLGHCPMGEISWFDSIQRAIGGGIAVVFAPQTLYGRLNLYVYEPQRKLKDIGVIDVGDMLPEVAYVKLGCVLAKKENLEEVAKEMRADWAGEISKCSKYDFKPEFD